MSIQPVPLEKAYRLLNIGATTLLSSHFNDIENVMSAAWVSALEITPAKVTAVIDKGAFTRDLIEKSGLFAIHIPTTTQAELVMRLGSTSRHNLENKLIDVPLFKMEGYDLPLVEGCAAWLICRVIPEPRIQQEHDLFLGEVLAAWADDRVFHNGHWEFDHAPDELKTLHYVAGGQFYQIGKGLEI